MWTLWHSSTCFCLEHTCFSVRCTQDVDSDDFAYTHHAAPFVCQEERTQSRMLGEQKMQFYKQVSCHCCSAFALHVVWCGGVVCRVLCIVSKRIPQHAPQLVGGVEWSAQYLLKQQFGRTVVVALVHSLVAWRIRQRKFGGCPMRNRRRCRHRREQFIEKRGSGFKGGLQGSLKGRGGGSFPHHRSLCRTTLRRSTGEQGGSLMTATSMTSTICKTLLDARPKTSRSL